MKKRIVICLIAVILINILAALLAVGCGLYFGATSPKTVFYTPGELEELFRERHDDFTAVAEMFLENEKLDGLMSLSSDRVILIYNTRDIDRMLGSDTMKDCFSEEERERIRALVTETGMSVLEYNARTAPVNLRFIYSKNREDTTLFFLASDEDEEAFVKSRQALSEQIYKIEDRWYIEHFTEEHFFKSIRDPRPKDRPQYTTGNSLPLGEGGPRQRWMRDSHK